MSAWEYRVVCNLHTYMKFLSLFAFNIAAIDASTRGVLNCGLVVCPERSTIIVERFGKYHRMLPPGLHLSWPWPFESMQEIGMREAPYHVSRQPAITRDNVDIVIDGVVYMRIVDPYQAHYAVAEPVESMLILAQTTVRSKIGEMTLDQTFKNRDELNAHVVETLRRVGDDWGIVVTRFEVKDIDPPESIVNAMKAEAEAERRKRATVLESEGYREAQVNKAEGEKTSIVLGSEAEREATVNIAKGNADAARVAAQAAADARVMEAEAEARANAAMGAALQSAEGKAAAQLKLADNYVSAFAGLGQRSSTLLLPANAADVPSMVAQAMAAFGGSRGPHDGEAGGS